MCGCLTVEHIVYPVRDRFQFGKVGSVINLHGPIRWFHKHSFERLSQGQVGSATGAADPGPGWLGSLALCLLTAAIVALSLLVYYTLVIRPRLLRRVMKKE